MNIGRRIILWMLRGASADISSAKALRQYLRRLVRGRASRFRVDAVVARAMRGGL